MNHTKVIALLQSFSKSELKKFEKFLHSPFSKVNDKVLIFFNYLQPLHPSYPQEAVHPEAIFQALFPRRSFVEKDIRDLRAKLTKEIKHFFIIQMALADESHNRSLLLQALSERNLYKLFNSELKFQKNKLEENPVRDMNFFLAKLKLVHKEYFHPATNQYEEKNLLTEISYNLDCFVILSKLRYANEYATRQSILQENSQQSLISEISQLARQKPFKDNQIYQIYLNLIELHKAPNDNQFFLYTKKLFIANSHRISPPERQIIWTSLINFSIRQYSYDPSTNLTQQFTLYQTGIENGYLITDNTISEMTYTNIAAIGAKLKKIEYTKHFLTTYRTLLKKEIRNSAFNLGLAYLNFHQSNYSTTISLLNNVTFNEVTNSLRCRSLKIRCLFELLHHHNYNLHLSHQLPAFKMFLNRNKRRIQPNRLLAYHNLIRYAQKILRNINRNQGYGMQKVIKELRLEENFQFKSWLLIQAKKFSKDKP